MQDMSPEETEEIASVTTISRSMILEKLAEWADGKLSPAEMHKWAQDLVSSDGIEFDDVDRERGFSAAREALTELEMLDMNFVTAFEIPAFVALLETAPHDFEKGYISFVSALQKIDSRKRMRELKNIEPYKTHCRG
jgi:hypothetical protein